MTVAGDIFQFKLLEDKEGQCKNVEDIIWFKESFIWDYLGNIAISLLLDMNVYVIVRYLHIGLDEEEFSIEISGFLREYGEFNYQYTTSHTFSYFWLADHFSLKF